MELLLSIIVLAILCCFVIPGFFGAPYVPTLNRQVDVSLDLLDLKPGQRLIELGCGDGKIALAAARRGLYVVAYELNPLLAAIAWLRTFRYRKQVTIIWGDFFKQELPATDGVFCFIMPKFMDAVDKKIEQSQPHPVKLVSFAMPIPHKKPLRQMENVYLYSYSGNTKK